MKSVRSLIAALLISGCASGGGGSGAGISLPPSPASNDDGLTDRERECLSKTTGFAKFACLEPPPSPQFTSWSAFPRQRGSDIHIDAISMETAHTSTGSEVTTVAAASSVGTGWVMVDYDQNAKLRRLDFWDFSSQSLSSTGATLSNLGAIGQPGFDIGLQGGVTASSPNPLFVSTTASSVAVAANPFVLGWEYQSFGVWSVPALKSPLSEQHGPLLLSASYGASTPANAVPTTGSATFLGKLGGLYVSPAGQGSVAFADLTVNANFSTRTLGFASTGTSVTRDLTTSGAAPNLNLSGTLTYAPGTNSFNGTLANAGGTVSGQSSGRFYGPAAQELGGVFTLRSPTTVETFSGGYGAKR